MGRQNRKHRKALEIIAADPEKFDLGHPDKDRTQIEVTLFDGKRAVAEPDITFYMPDGKIRLVEYKENGHQEQALIQLTNAKWWYGKYKRDINPDDIEAYIISGSDPKYKKFFEKL